MFMDRVLRLRAGQLRWLAPLASLAMLAVVLPAAHGDSTCDQFGATPVDGGRYIVQNNEWNSNSPQCVNTTGGTGWTVSTGDQNAGTDGPPGSYPSIYRGCHWGRCTTGSGLPVQVSRLGPASSSWSTTEPQSGAYDTSYDIWFNSTPTTSGQPDGAELMIWLNSRGGVRPAGSMVGTATIDGATWQVWKTRMNSWNYIAYVRESPTTAVNGLDIRAFTQDAESRGSVQPSWYLMDVEAGFELWQGGHGMTTNSFSFDPSGGAPASYRAAPDHRSRRHSSHSRRRKVTRRHRASAPAGPRR